MAKGEHMAWMTWDDVSCRNCGGDAAVQVGTGSKKSRTHAYLCASCDDLRRTGDVGALAQRWIDAGEGRRRVSLADRHAESVLELELEMVRPPASDDQTLRPRMHNFDVIEWDEEACAGCRRQGTVLMLLVLGDRQRNEFTARTSGLCAACADLWERRDVQALGRRIGGKKGAAEASRLVDSSPQQMRPRDPEGAYVASSRRPRD